MVEGGLGEEMAAAAEVAQVAGEEQSEGERWRAQCRTRRR